MSNDTWQVTMYVRVNHRRTLWETAKSALIRDGVDESLWPGLIGTPEEPDIGGCLTMVLDPGQSPMGISILETTTEH